MWDRKTPTDNADEETKDNFYCSLPAVLDNIPKHDVTWLMVDFSARVRQEKSDGSTGSRRYHIQHRHQRLRGKWRHIVIDGTLFAHKALSSITWEHYKPDRPHHEEQPMEAISIGLQAVRHVHIGSGHNLVIAKIGLKLRRARIRTNKSKWFDVKLEDPGVGELFYIMLRNRYSKPQDDTNHKHLFLYQQGLQSHHITAYLRGHGEHNYAKSWKKHIMHRPCILITANTRAVSWEE